MRVTLWWHADRVRFILRWDAIQERDRTDEEVRRFKNKVARRFYYKLQNAAWEARMATLEERGVEDDGTALTHEYFQLVGQHFVVHVYPYIIDGLVTNFDALSDHFRVSLRAVGLDVGRRRR